MEQEISDNLRQLIEIGNDDNHLKDEDLLVDAMSAMAEFDNIVHENLAIPFEDGGEATRWIKLMHMAGAVHLGTAKIISELKRRHCAALEKAISQTQMKPAEERKACVLPEVEEIIDAPLANWESFQQQLDGIIDRQLEQARANNFYHLQEEDEQAPDLSERTNFFVEEDDVPLPEVDVQVEEQPVENGAVDEVIEPEVEELINQLQPLEDEEHVNEIQVGPPAAAGAVPAPPPPVRGIRNRRVRNQNIDFDGQRSPIHFIPTLSVDPAMYALVDIAFDLPMDEFEREFFVGVYSEQSAREIESSESELDAALINEFPVPDESHYQMDQSPAHQGPMDIEQILPEQQPLPCPSVASEVDSEIDLSETEAYILEIGRNARCDQKFYIDDFIAGEITIMKKVLVYRCIAKLHDEYKLTAFATEDFNPYVLFDMNNDELGGEQ